MFEGDDAAHCSNGLTATKFRESSDAERSTYRKWIRGMVIVYCALLLAFGVGAFINSDPGRMQVTNLRSHATLAPSHPD